MNRESINPTEWGLKWSFDQGEVVTGATRHLRTSGQISVVPDENGEYGFSVISPNEIRGQMERALANVDAVLEKAGMTRANVVSMRIFTTKVDAFLAHYDVYADWIAEAGVRPPQSLVEVRRLVLPELLVEIEVEAAA
jgi:enamine deaminase RidA (YjgF/YER057c/UK114 family)